MRGHASRAYDAGRLFVLNYDGVLRAYSADLGVLLWSHTLPGAWYGAAPVASQGVVYVNGPWYLTAIDEETGRLR
jgi:outer membrane protein assembly factor BamB